MIIEVLTVTPFQQNCRLVFNPDTLNGSIIDPGGEATVILNAINRNQLNIESILLTHSHIDHCGAVRDLLDELNSQQKNPVKLYAHKIEQNFRAGLEQQAMMFGLSPAEFKNCPEPDVYLDQADTVNIADKQFEVRFTPGHSPGHLSFITKEHIDYQIFGPDQQMSGSAPLAFSGDALFAGSIGRTDLPGGDYQTLINAIHSQLFTLADNTIIMPGHGPDTTILRERTSNPFLIAGAGF